MMSLSSNNKIDITKKIYHKYARNEIMSSVRKLFDVIILFEHTFCTYYEILYHYIRKGTFSLL